MSSPAAAFALGGVVVVLVLVAGPPMLLRALTRAYPLGHPRRQELVAELDAVPYRRRPAWVAGLAAACLTEAAAVRRSRAVALGKLPKLERRKLWMARSGVAVLGLVAIPVTVQTVHELGFSALTAPAAVATAVAVTAFRLETRRSRKGRRPTQRCDE